MTRRQWQFQTHDGARIAELAAELRVPALVAQLLLARGLSHPQVARDFLDCKLQHLRPPEALPGIAAAAERVWQAARAGEKITIYGDYDVDGMTATAVLYLCLKALGAQVGYFVPNRLEEGYGLNAEALATLASQGTRLVVTVDCGVTAVAEAARAAELGLDLVITDHHQLGAELPQAAAIVHPLLPGSNYPFAGLSGSGVAFKLAWALCQRASGSDRVPPRLKEFLMQAVGLAGLGTIADVVPLVDENRVLVRHALESLATRPTVGIAALLKLAELNGKQRLDSEDVAFAIAPRLNAAGRLGQAQLGVELLITESASRGMALAEYLSELNKSRQSLERSIYLAAHKQLKEEFDPERDPAFVLAGREWHVGVIGIVAGKLAEKYQRPVVLLALDELGVRPSVGSGRSVPGIDLYQALDSCRQHLVQFGGHAAAAGLKLEEARLEDFRADFCEYVATERQGAARGTPLAIDAEAPLAMFTQQAVSQIERLAPFGQQNPRPVFCATGVELAESPRPLGGGGQHLSMKVRQNGTLLRAVAFGQADWADELAGVNGPLAIAFRPVLNTFRGRCNVELHLVDWLPARETAAAVR